MADLERRIQLLMDERQQLEAQLNQTEVQIVQAEHVIGTLGLPMPEQF